jgi:hypothetical protein
MVEEGDKAKEPVAQDDDNRWTSIGVPVRVKALLDDVSEHHNKVYGKRLSQVDAIVEMYRAWKTSIESQA